jgi:hypothetical protein
MSPKSLHSWLKLNADYASIWPHIAVKRESPADAKEFDGVPNKLEQFFSPNPGQGDEMNERREITHQRLPNPGMLRTRGMGRTHSLGSRIMSPTAS